MNLNFCTYDRYILMLDSDNGEFSIKFKSKIITDKMFFAHDGKRLNVVRCENTNNLEHNSLTVKYTLNENFFDIVFEVSRNGIFIKKDDNIDMLALSGETNCGDDCIAMSTAQSKNIIRAAMGHTCSTTDNVLFNKHEDKALLIDGVCGKRFSFNNNKKQYEIHADFKDCIRISMAENIYSDKFDITFSPVNKNSTFSKSPTGWMTWYAVKFDASEKTVLENAKFQAEKLKDYGANAIWVDWEWYHKDLTGARDDGADTFNPDKEKYPNGMKFVSYKIKEYGFTPVLWIGYTNDPGENEYIKNNPEIVLAKDHGWCGQYFFDFSHPKYLNEFLPMALKQVSDWGYEAVKFDTLPISLQMHEKNHASMYDPELSTKDAFRNMIKKTREILGENMYMLSCAGYNDSDILWCCDMFDAARIGDDIFSWNEFITECVLRTIRYFPLHNIVFYNDPDNVIVREEYNTYDQAVSRAVFVSMLGMPITFGDNLPELPDERVNILRRVIPSPDVCPKDINIGADKPDIMVTNLSINMDWENYNVVSVLNTTEKDRKYYFDLQKDAELSGSRYHIYDFWHDEYLGCLTEGIELELRPCETRVLAVRADSGLPQIISTNRHITQGAAEIVNLSCSDMEMNIECDLVKNDAYKITIYLPTGYAISGADMFDVKADGNIAELTFIPNKTEKYNLKIRFKR